MKTFIFLLVSSIVLAATWVHCTFGGLETLIPALLEQVKSPAIQAETMTDAPETLTDILAEEPYEYAYAGFDPSPANLNIPKWHLLLVNRDFILPEDFEVTLAPAVADDPESLMLDYRVAPHFNEMYLAALEDGVELKPVSGYRSQETQRNNFHKKIDSYVAEGYSVEEATQMASTIVLLPGTSEHNAGFAMDINSLEQDFDKTEEFAWLCENAADYGFILRYPEDKQHITKIIYEPWHWRYVGVEAAQFMVATGQCFEEYLGVVEAE